MNLLIIGSGAREHALAWKLAQSPRVERVLVAPGNAGTARMATNLPIPAGDIPTLLRAAREHQVGLAVVGPEAPLVAGIVDRFQAEGIPIFGPTQAAAAIEGSKAYARALMEKYGIPCARGQTFADYTQAQHYVESHPLPLVVKADGLAGGKGAFVCPSRQEALNALRLLMVEHALGEAGDRVIIEECLTGLEVSLQAFTDGDMVVPMVPVCDYKRAYDGDRGPNTGGMGGYSPPRFAPPELVGQATEAILRPIVRALAREGRPYKGALYAGLILTERGPRVLEFNARLGDPEAQVTLPRLQSDLVDILLACIQGTLDRISVQWSRQACVGVVLASGGYPGDYATDFPVSGWDCLDEDALVFHAGTRLEGNRIVTSGGRVFTVVALGRDLREARNKAYLNVPCLRFQGRHYREDIAAREVGPLPDLLTKEGKP